jgi:hypothetical protein
VPAATRVAAQEHWDQGRALNESSSESESEAVVPFSDFDLETIMETARRAYTELSGADDGKDLQFDF